MPSEMEFSHKESRDCRVPTRGSVYYARRHLHGGRNGAYGMKYGNRPCSFNGISFHSILEKDRYVELYAMQKAGEIKNLQCQVKYRLEVNGVLIGNYIADFVYETKHGREVIEDTKSVATVTDTNIMKERLMKAVHGITVVRVYRSQVGGGTSKRKAAR